MSLLISVFVLQLLIHLVNTVGAPTVNAVLWNIYNRLPTPTSNSAAEQKKQQKEYLKLRQELNSTSSQDEFAKWAKLRRQHDKLLEALEKNKASLDSTKATFDKIVSGLRWLGTNGARMLLQFWFQKTPIFWLPYGWLPYYAEWLLSFPRAPLGSISIQAWGLACGAIILLVSDAIVASIGLAVSQSAAIPQEKRKESAVQAEPKGNTADKKEL